LTVQGALVTVGLPSGPRIMPHSRRAKSPLLKVALLAVALAMGCAGAPVQQMSDARQAVRAAQKADAKIHAPDLLAEAEKLLASAKANLDRGEYRLARDEAEMARARAMEARRIAEAATADPATP